MLILTQEEKDLLWQEGVKALIDEFTRAFLVNKIKQTQLPETIKKLEDWFTDEGYDYNHLYSNEEFKEETIKKFPDVKDPMELVKQWELIKTTYTTKYYKLQEELASWVVLEKEIAKSWIVLADLKKLLTN